MRGVVHCVVHCLVPLLAAGCAVSTDWRRPVDAPPPPAPAESAVYAALPLQNLAPDIEAARALLVLLRRGLEDRGARFVPEEELERVLRERRIRYLDSVSVADAREIGSVTGARYLLLGSLLASAREPSPRISVALRVIDARTGRRIQSRLVSLRGADFAGLLGLGEIEDHGELTREVAARLLDGFDPTGRPGPRRAAGGLARWRTSNTLSTFLHADFDPAQMDRIAVLPFHDRTRAGASAGGVLVPELLSHEWFAAGGVDVVEQSELRAVLRRLEVRSIEDLDLALLREAGRELGTRYFVLGSVDRFREDVGANSEAFPEVQAALRIVDVERGQLLAATGLHRRGDDYHVLLGLGSVRDPIALADRVARSMIAAVSE